MNPQDILEQLRQYGPDFASAMMDEYHEVLFQSPIITPDFIASEAKHYAENEFIRGFDTMEQRNAQIGLYSQALQHSSAASLIDASANVGSPLDYELPEELGGGIGGGVRGMRSRVLADDENVRGGGGPSAEMLEFYGGADADDGNEAETQARALLDAGLQVQGRKSREQKEAIHTEEFNLNGVDYSFQYEHANADYWRKVNEQLYSTDYGWASSVSPTSTGGIPGAVLGERFNKKGGYTQRARTSTGLLGRSFTNDKSLLNDIRNVLRACLLENYDQKIKSDTGTGKQAVEQGELTTDTNAISYTFTLKDLQGGKREWGKPEKRLSTNQYLPIVFYGRGPILRSANQEPMAFQAGGQWHQRRVVAAAKPRNIFELTSNQIERINSVILRPLTDPRNSTIKDLLEGYGLT